VGLEGSKRSFGCVDELRSWSVDGSFAVRREAEAREGKWRKGWSFGSTVRFRAPLFVGRVAERRRGAAVMAEVFTERHSRWFAARFAAGDLAERRGLRCDGERHADRMSGFLLA
jgi:hypothetical protein